MGNNFRDTASRIVLAATSGVFLDAPKRCAYGVLLGLFFSTLQWILREAAHWQFYVPELLLLGTGVFSCNWKAIFYCVAGKPTVAEKYERLFEIVRLASKAGMSSAHVNIQLVEICRLAIADSRDGIKVDPLTRKTS